MEVQRPAPFQGNRPRTTNQPTTTDGQTNTSNKVPKSSDHISLYHSICPTFYLLIHLSIHPSLYFSKTLNQYCKAISLIVQNNLPSSYISMHHGTIIIQFFFKARLSFVDLQVFHTVVGVIIAIIFQFIIAIIFQLRRKIIC